MPRSLHPVVGDSKLTFVGHSYGSLVGATYAGLFPGRARALLLVDPIDADTWVNRPFEAIREQAAGLEHGLGRFFAACAVHQNACGFGATDPQNAFDDLAAALDAAPAPAPRAADPRPVDGDDLRFASMYAMISPGFWPGLATALREAQGGDGSALRDLTDKLAYERTPAGDSPTLDVNWVTLANDQRYPQQIAPFLAAGRHSASLFDHTYPQSGYGEVAMGQLPVKPEGAFRGPFRNASGATPALVVGVTHDPWTPFAWARRLVADLGNAQMLTFRGDMNEIDPVVNGGADTITVGDLSATAVDEVNVNLEPNLGTPGGDGLPDRVIAAGTDGDDAVTVSGGANGAVAVTGLAARLGITHAESIDSLAIDTRAGHDTVDASGLAPNTIQLTTD
jgi:pimeloyl-ACP methyl ester carboxylesterase